MDASDDSSSDLSLSCSFALFEQSDLESDESSYESIESYQFELIASHSEPTDASFNTDEVRLNNSDW